ncbi:hypothetical protein RN001_011837 [Aquatica leii]|uniref:DDE Tnp4 domain-containing protein n=1 Tax=Aquatica leii TaxID=1421715 RepID=A0AAN7SP92_9COLE|nr:hypothetical protein RN001_011837 [Aquatica leii]
MNNKRKAMIVIAALQIIDSSESEDEFVINELHCTKKTKRRQRIAVEKYIENVAAHYDAEEFRSHFRLRRETFEHLLQILAPALLQQNAKGVGRHTHSAEMQLLVALSMLANQVVYRLISEKYNIAKSTAWAYVNKVCCCLVQLSDKYISWPTRCKTHQLMQQFEAQHGFPGVLGAIDGTHIPITAPSKDQAAYCNRHQYHSIILQAICDANYKFIDVFAGYAGSVHDARVFTINQLQK